MNLREFLSHSLSGKEAKVVTKEIPAGDLRFDRDNYQREPNHKRIRSYVENYNPIAALGVVVSQRADGSYWVIDGQHRVMATMRRMGIDHPMNCYVIQGLSPAEEAELFTLINTHRGPVPAGAKAKALVGANHATWTQMVKIVSDLGLQYDFERGGAKQDNLFRAWGTIGIIEARGGLSLVDRVLRFILGAWGGDRRSLTSDCIKGTCEFILNHDCDLNPRYSDSEVVAALQRTPFETISMEMQKNVAMGVMRPKAYAHAIKWFYNKGRRSGKLRTKSDE